jgi:hypothetical protein
MRGGDSRYAGEGIDEFDAKDAGLRQIKQMGRMRAHKVQIACLRIEVSQQLPLK